MYVFPNFKYLSEYFAQIYRAQYGAAMLVYLQGTPAWRPENSVNISSLLWLSDYLNWSGEHLNRHFSWYLTFEKAKNPEISRYFLEGIENKRRLQTSIDNIENAWSNKNFLYYLTFRMLQHTSSEVNGCNCYKHFKIQK